MNPTSSNPSNGACSSENTTPDLIDLVLQFVKEKFPDSQFSHQDRWGIEIFMDGQLVGAVLNHMWLRWCWTKEQVTNNDHKDMWTAATDPRFFDIIEDSCRSRSDYK
jgi:hypothetical protein